MGIDLFPTTFSKAYYKSVLSSFQTLVMTKPYETTRWHYEGFYPGLEQMKVFPECCVLNIKFKANEDSDIVSDNPNDYVLDTVEKLYNPRTEQDVQWCENKNIRSTLQ